MIQEIREVLYQCNTSITEFHDTGETVTLVSEWSDIYKIQTAYILNGGCYHLYQKAINKLGNQDKTTQVEWQGKWYPVIVDLRLGSNGYFPSQDEPYYSVPDEVEAIEEQMVADFGEFVFTDEYMECDRCYKAMRTSPDSYCWQPEYIWLDECTAVHHKCLDVDDVADWLQHHIGDAIPDCLMELVDELDIIELEDYEYSNGFHRGQDDDPKIITAKLKEVGISCWFSYSPSQFYVDFSPMVERDNAEKARKILANVNAYQGYSNAGEMSKALKGEHSDHITMRTYTITPEQFEKGEYPDEDTEDC